MDLSLEPPILNEWLVSFNLTLDTLTELPQRLQAQLINFLLPDEEVELDEKHRLSLYLLGWQVGTRNSRKAVSKTLWRSLFRLFLAVKELGPAAYTFSKLWEEPDSSKITYFRELIQLKLAQGNLEAAQEAYGEMRNLYPVRFTTFMAGAEIHIFQGNLEDARLAFLTGLEISPLSSQLMLNLADLAYKQNRPEEATAWLEEVEEHSDTGKILYLKAARIWQKLGNYKKAGQIFNNRALFREEKRALLCQQIQEVALVAEISPVDTFSDIEFKQTSPVQPEVGGTFMQGEPGLAHSPLEVALPEKVYILLKQVFGYSEFRPGQAQVIANILAGHDTLAVLPTGAGKSLCYQLPALLLKRPVLVLSPLISLMKDQFDKLPEELKENTLIINSSLNPAEAARYLVQLSQPGHSIRLIYAAPERLRQTSFTKALQNSGLDLVVVDEAHCVAMWGNDFRPDYLFIRKAASRFNTPVLAVTATATPQVTQEIARELDRDFKIVRGSGFRSNLKFSVEKILTNIEMRLGRVVELCQALPGSGIIYTRSREKCEKVAGYLRQHGINAQPYHAGMDSATRHRTQVDWTSGQILVIVATIAFGMGIDKPDVRFIIHFSPATSLENYMQEAGRAGRDGQVAHCIMFYSPSDKASLTRWLREENSHLNLAILREVYRIITRKLGNERRGIIPINDILAGPYSTFPPPDEGFIRVACSLLEGAGLMERGFDLPLEARISLPFLEPPAPLPLDLAGFLLFIGLDRSDSATIDLVTVATQLKITAQELDARLMCWHEAGFLNYQASKREPYFELKEAGSDVRARIEYLLNRRQEEAENRLDKLDHYLKAKGCRQTLLANHFGERLGHTCGVCDNCTGKGGKTKVAHISKQTGTRSIQHVGQIAIFSPDEITALILGCLHQITGGQGQVGKTGLANLLLGKPNAFGTTANNPYKGKLEVFKRKEVTSLVDKLVLTGLVEEHPATLGSGKTYQAIRVSDRGHLWLESHSNLLP